MHLDTQTGLAPVPPLSVVAIHTMSAIMSAPVPPRQQRPVRPRRRRGGSSDDFVGRIVPDGVVRSETNPLRDGAVLLLRLGELLLGAERLVALFAVQDCDG